MKPEEIAKALGASSYQPVSGISEAHFLFMTRHTRRKERGEKPLPPSDPVPIPERHPEPK